VWEEALVIELVVVITKYEDVMVAHEEVFWAKFIVTKELDKGFVNWGYCKTWIKSEKRQWGRGDAKAWDDDRNFPNVLMS
jgi:hypothetical protein